jgi:hypothetical protein
MKPSKSGKGVWIGDKKENRGRWTDDGREHKERDDRSVMWRVRD